jgi:hypothetical protein
MDKLTKIAYNCRKATLLIEKQQMSRLTMGERVELKIHLTGCSICRMYQQQSIIINKMIKDLFNARDHHRGLDVDFKKSLQDRINKKLLK